MLTTRGFEIPSLLTRILAHKTFVLIAVLVSISMKPPQPSPIFFRTSTVHRCCRWSLNTLIQTSDAVSQRLTHPEFGFHHSKCTIPVKVSWLFPFFSILSKSIGSYQLLATQASPDEEVVPDEFLNQILSAKERSPEVSSEKLCTTFIDKLLKAGNPSAAAKLLQSLHEKHIFLSSNAYNLLLVAASEVNSIGLLSQIFMDILVFNIPLSSTSYLNIAKAFTKTDDSVLLKFVREVSELTFPRNATILNRIIHAFAECSQIDKSLVIFDLMKSLKCKPDLITYNTVLWILGRAGRLDEMLHEFSSMGVANISPDIISYNTLLNSLQKFGRLDLCSVFFREMGENGLKPDLRTYQALIEGFGRSGNLEEALRLFAEMKQGHIRASIYIYRSLINYSKKMGKVELAMSLLEEMNACLPDLIGPKDFKQKNRQLRSLKQF